MARRTRIAASKDFPLYRPPGSATQQSGYCCSAVVTRSCQGNSEGGRVSVSGGRVAVEVANAEGCAWFPHPRRKELKCRWLLPPAFLPMTKVQFMLREIWGCIYHCQKTQFTPPEIWGVCTLSPRTFPRVTPRPLPLSASSAILWGRQRGELLLAAPLLAVELGISSEHCTYQPGPWASGLNVALGSSNRTPPFHDGEGTARRAIGRDLQCRSGAPLAVGASVDQPCGFDGRDP